MNNVSRMGWGLGEDFNASWLKEGLEIDALKNEARNLIPFSDDSRLKAERM